MSGPYESVKVMHERRPAQTQGVELAGDFQIGIDVTERAGGARSADGNEIGFVALGFQFLEKLAEDLRRIRICAFDANFRTEDAVEQQVSRAAIEGAPIRYGIEENQEA